MCTHTFTQTDTHQHAVTQTPIALSHVQNKHTLALIHTGILTNIHTCTDNHSHTLKSQTHNHSVAHAAKKTRRVPHEHTHTHTLTTSAFKHTFRWRAYTHTYIHTKTQTSARTQWPVRKGNNIEHLLLCDQPRVYNCKNCRNYWKPPRVMFCTYTHE